MSRMSRTHKIIIAAGLAVILIVILVVSCTPKKAEPVQSAGTASSGTFASAPCAPPLACGPYYAGYVPTYFIAHPSYSYLSPYGSLYAPVVVAGGTYRTRANPTPPTRRPMPYPSGYKPVPGDFVPPTAPAAAPTTKATAQAPAPTKAPASQPTKAAPAPTKAAPAPAVPDKKQTQKKTETKKVAPAAPKVPTRSRIGR